MFEDMAKKAAATLLLTVAFFSMALCQDVEKKLHCYFCSYKEPCSETPIQCEEGEKCGTMLGHLDYKVHHPIYGKGCVPAVKCGSREKFTYMNAPFRMNYTCCDTNYCNKKDVFGPDYEGIAAAGHTSVHAHLPWLFAATLLAALPAFFS